ncbi:substrate-binding domain-containing protein [Butyrivibrio sp. NC3005]|uniref:substrate-binding domain-containing protein n=1 Tax=Butyrivibrio sp. NC3005 TaxID=1280685 RepID=UPI0009DBC766|nr:substrate-binding domain-containing protein [Butyrivibrio sp. NC3005]
MSSSKKNLNNKIGRRLLLTILLSFILVVAIFIAMTLLRFNMTRKENLSEVGSYDKYYVMITDNYKSDFWQSVYKGALEEAKKNNTYIDLLGEKLSGNYSSEDLMKIAIASKVDGIVISSTESSHMAKLIDEASKNDIPVVTLYIDHADTSRISFAGVGSFNIGREYGRQVLNIIKEKRKEDFMEASKMKNRKTMQIAVLVNSDSKDTGQNLIISGLQETIMGDKTSDSEFSVSLVTVENTNAFSAEESIRDIFLKKEIPDILICLNELNTICAYQAVVDHNKVGEVNILGYHDSDMILKAIDRGVIYATISIDTRQLGEYCVTALSDYYEIGNTNQYYSADVTLINKDNVKNYMKKGEDNQND